MEKGLLPSMLLKRYNYEERNQFNRRKLNEVPMLVSWTQGNQDAEMAFSVIPFQTRFIRIQQVPEPGTGQLVDREVTRAAEMVYKRISQAKEQDARKWIQQKERGWKIIIDYFSPDMERDLQ
jgi:hypothetical protein